MVEQKFAKGKSKFSGHGTNSWRGSESWTVRVDTYIRALRYRATRLGKVLRWISQRVVLPILVVSLGAFLMWVFYLALSRDHRPRITLHIPLLGAVQIFPPMYPGGLDPADGFDARDRSEFIKRFRLDPSTNESIAFREILLYGSIENMEDFPELGNILGMFAGGIPGSYWSRGSVLCPRARTAVGVTVSTRIEEFQRKDAVVFGMMPKMLAKNLETLVNKEPPAGQTWVYFSTESPFRAMRWVKDPDMVRLKYHKLMTYNAKADIPFPFGYTVTNKSSNSNTKNLVEHNFAKGKSKLIAWMASNCEEIFWPRNEFVERIRELVRVDTYGRCGAIDCLPRGSERCKRIISQYKFYLALSNAECRDYITEKFWDTALRHGVVPVVGGSPREDFERLAPPESFIHISDFQSVKELVDYLLFLDKHDIAYNKYFSWKQTSGVVINFPPKQDIFCQILPHLNDMSKAVPRLKELGYSPWFKTCRNAVSISSAVLVRSRVLDNNFDKWTPWRL